MKLEDNMMDASIQVTCKENNMFEPSVPEWQKCFGSKLDLAHSFLQYNLITEQIFVLKMFAKYKLLAKRCAMEMQ